MCVELHMLSFFYTSEQDLHYTRGYLSVFSDDISTKQSCEADRLISKTEYETVSKNRSIVLVHRYITLAC